MDIAGLQQSFDFPQPVPRFRRGQALAAASGPEAIAAGVKLGLKDRFDRHLERRLHNAVPSFRLGQALDRRYPQRTGSPAALVMSTRLTGDGRYLPVFNVS